MHNIPYKDSLLYAKVAYLKRYPECLLSDVQVMYPIIFKKLGNQLSSISIQYAMECYSELCKKPHPSSEKTRVYVLTSSCRFLLTLYDMDKSVVEEMILDREVSEEYISRPYAVMDLSPDYDLSTTLFAFNSNGLASCNDLSANELANLLVGFRQENLVNYRGVRDTLYGKPRRSTRNR